MIRSLALRGWRSYEDLELELGPGTTFVVAPNGVGKTSLVYGLAWGVFGDQSTINPRHCIRAGASMAEVDVELELPGGRRLTIHRLAKRKGSPTATYEMDGARLTQRSALAEMEQTLGIELPVASRLSMMLGGGHVAATEALKLDSHLHQVFGVAHLLSAAETAESVAKDAAKARASLRSTTRQRMDNRAELESDIARLEKEVASLRNRATELKRARDAAAEERSLAERHLALADQRERFAQQRSELLAVIENLLGRPVPSDTNGLIESELRTELESSHHAIREMTEGVVKARSTVTAAEQALQLLDVEDAICPTCMRPLPHDERALAISAHERQHQAAAADVQRLDETRTTRQRHVQSVSRLLAQLEALQPPSKEVGDTELPSPDVAEALFQQTAADLDEHNLRLGGARSRLESLKAQIASDDQVQEEQRSLQQAYRREALAVAGALALRSAVDHVIQTRIEPLANEVRTRWKHLFTSNGLTFSSDGSITRLRGDEELAWDTLSGGERTWARIVTHLIVMGTTTSLPFAWFDEPLEHLDPQLRHAVAATLATATLGGSPRQLLVTTYEHGIAQQLSDAIEGAEVIAIRESAVSSVSGQGLIKGLQKASLDRSP